MSKTDQGTMFKLPKGTAHTQTPNGGHVVSDYGKKPVSNTYNEDRGEFVPRDPQRANRGR